MARVTGDLVLGAEGAGVGTALVTGDGSEVILVGLSINARSSIIVGENGHGDLQIMDGGDLTATDFVDSLVIARGGASSGSLLIDGGAMTFAGQDFIVGEGGSASLSVLNGGVLTTTAVDEFGLAAQPGSSADVLISGPGSSWTSLGASRLVISGGGEASVRVEDGGTLDAFGLTNTAGGTLGGDGTIVADVNNYGDLAPGRLDGTPGMLTIDGDYLQIDSPSSAQFSGRVLLDLVSDGQGGAIGDSLNITGTVGLAGAMVVRAEPGLDLIPGTVLPLLQTTQAIGGDRLDVALLPGLPGGKFFRLAYDLEGPGSGSVSLIVDSLSVDLGFGGPSDTSVSGLPESAELEDMNGDGLPDVILAVPDDVNPSGAPGAVLVLLNGGVDGGGVWQGFSGGTFQANTGIGPSDVAVGDLDGDAVPDIAVSNRQDATASVFVNNGAGVPVAFAAIAFNQEPEAIVIGDLDEDGRNDIAVAGSEPDETGVLTTRLNAGGIGGGWAGLGSSRNFAIGDATTFMDIGDLDNDSCLDLLIGSRGDDGINLLDNLGGGQGNDWAGFAPPLVFLTGQFPIAGDIGDLDNDSCLDILVADSLSGELAVLLHTGGPGVFTFTPPASIPAGPNPRSVVASDLDGDGDGDVALVTDSDDGLTRVVRLLRNDLDPAVGQLQFAPASLVDTGGEPLLVLSDDVDGADGQDLVAITEGSGEMERDGGGRGDGRGPGGVLSSVSTALNIEKGSPGCNEADIAKPFGVLDLADIGAFINGFTSQAPIADIDGNGIFDLTDVNVFIARFVAGCP